MAKQINARIITKHDYEEKWEKAKNFKPERGEIIIYEYDKPNSVPRIKIGNGQDNVSNLPYITEPYVLKEKDMGLSEQNYTIKEKEIVKILLDAPSISLTDTIYEATNGLGLQENKFYNLGVLDIEAGDEEKGDPPSSIILHLGESLNSTKPKTVILKGIEENTKKKIILESIDQFIKTVRTGEENGSISINGIDIFVKGLNELAFKTKEELQIPVINPNDFIEIYISKEEDKNNLPDGIKLWIDEVTGKLEYYNNGFFYKINNGGILESASYANEEGRAGFLKFINNDNTYYEIQTAPIISSAFNNGAYFLLDDGVEQKEIYTGALSLSGGILDGNLNFHIPIDKGSQISQKYTKRIGFIDNEGLENPDNMEAFFGGIEQSVHFSNNDQNELINTIKLEAAAPSKTLLNSSYLYVKYNWNILNQTETAEAGCYGATFIGGNFNDYAEYRQSIEHIEPGYIVYSDDDGILRKTKNRLQHFEGVVSDTFGFSIGKTDKAQTPLAVAGRVLVYTDEELHAGDVVCAGENGKASKMDNIEIANKPDRIVGIVSEIPTYDTWGENNVSVNGRVWIRIK